MKKKFFIVLLIVIFNLAPYNQVLSTHATSLMGDVPPAGDGITEQEINEPPTIEIVNPNFTVEHYTLQDGTTLSQSIIIGAPHPPVEFESERAASMTPLPSAGIISEFPSYSWVFGCSAVSGAMIAGYYDRHGYPNMFAGPSNGGVMPFSDTAWSTWSDGYETYPNNPLVASHLGVDGRSVRGSIDDYWVSYMSNVDDPHIGSWAEHTWSDSIGDYMKTSQSKWPYENVDGSTRFWNYGDATKLPCAMMESATAPGDTYKISQNDGTYGRKLFYEARGYTVTECFNQRTYNSASGGFSLANLQAEIDSGNPVMINVTGHTMVAYGYSGSTVYIRDTWDNDPTHTYTMVWDSTPTYQGMTLYAVSIVKLAQGTLPPSAPINIISSDGTYTDKVRVIWGNSLELNNQVFLPLMFFSGDGFGPIVEQPYFQVYRNTVNSTSGAQMLVDHHPNSPFDDTTAAAGTIYYYWVKACNSGGCSEFSSSDSGYRAAGSTSPVTPTSVSASDGTYTEKVENTWNESAGAPYSKVYRDTNEDHIDESELTDSYPGSPYDDTTALAETTYYYWVKACNSFGC